jgi:hypothetical protein
MSFHSEHEGKHDDAGHEQNMGRTWAEQEAELKRNLN